MRHFQDPVAIDPRVDEILAQARNAFVEKGFDGASMQDLARAAGMSAGNFYRYFPSKAAIVEAMISRDLEQVEQEFLQISQSPRPMEALRDRFRYRMSDNCNEDHPLWAEIMAVAARKPDVAAACGRMQSEICRQLTRVFAIIARVDPETAAARYAAHARLMFMLVHGAIMENANNSNPQSDLIDLILRTIDRLVEEIAADAPGE
jgi:AcrR family transcriptional regulator